MATRGRRIMLGSALVGCVVQLGGWCWSLGLGVSAMLVACLMLIGSSGGGGGPSMWMTTR